MKILLLEDDLDLGKALCKSLEINGFHVLWLRTIKSAQHEINNSDINLLLLDLTLPDGEGLEVLKKWRQERLSLPIIVITARDKLDDLTITLDSGADDFLTKPFLIPELISRINAVHRRIIGYKSQLWIWDDVSIDPLTFTATVKGKKLRLSRKEFNILSELILNAGNIVPKTKLEHIIFDNAESNTLEVHIHNLRKKIGKGKISTVRRVGYFIHKDKE